MRMFDVQGVEIRAPRSKVFEFLCNPETCRNGPTHSYQRRMVGSGSRPQQEP